MSHRTRIRCELCHERTATFHLTRKGAEKSITLHLCAECAHKYGADDPVSFDFANLPDSLYNKNSRSE